MPEVDVPDDGVADVADVAAAAAVLGDAAVIVAAVAVAADDGAPTAGNDVDARTDVEAAVAEVEHVEHAEPELDDAQYRGFHATWGWKSRKSWKCEYGKNDVTNLATVPLWACEAAHVEQPALWSVTYLLTQVLIQQTNDSTVQDLKEG